MGQLLDEEQKAAILEECPELEVSMLDIIEAARSVGVSLTGVRASLDELGTMRGPKIIHLEDPNHFLVVCRLCAEWVQVLEVGQAVVWPRAEVEKRYSGRALLGMQDEAVPGPRLEMDEYHFPFGVSGIGQEIEHTFRVRNAGDGDLCISLQARDCSAPDAHIDRETLREGETAEIGVRFVIAHSGDVVKSVRLLTNDLRQPVAFLTLHGKVPHNLEVWPDTIRANGRKGQALQRSVLLTGPEDMAVTGVSCERGLFAADVGEPRVTETKRVFWEIQLTLQSTLRVGSLRDQLTIHTTHKDRPVITIPITGQIRGDLEWQPLAVFFGFVKAGDSADQEVVLGSRSGAAIAVKEAVCDHASVTVGRPTQRGGHWVIPVRADTSQPGVIDATVTVTTDVPGEETLRFSVYAHVADG